MIIFGNRQAAQEAVRYDEDESETREEPEMMKAKPGEDVNERRIGGENEASDAAEDDGGDGEVEKRYLALISAGQVPLGDAGTSGTAVASKEDGENRVQARTTTCGQPAITRPDLSDRTYGDLDYLPHREHETSSNSSGDYNSRKMID